MQCTSVCTPQLNGYSKWAVLTTLRKIQQLGTADLYKSDEDVKQFCGKLDVLAFLPLRDVQAGQPSTFVFEYYTAKSLS